MKTHKIAIAVAALAMGLSGHVFAQDRRGGEEGHDRGRGPAPQAQARDDHRGDARRGDDRRGEDRRGEDHRGDDRRDFRPGPDWRADHGPRDFGRRGAGPEHNYYRGGRLPAEWRNRQYVVDDWRGHRLSAPPRGYHWVQTGSDYVLVAIATGIIASILLSN